jgi:hypothetical protein
MLLSGLHAPVRMLGFVSCVWGGDAARPILMVARESKRATTEPPLLSRARRMIGRKSCLIDFDDGVDLASKRDDLEKVAAAAD